MVKELKGKLNNIEESRKELDYALDMLEEGVGFNSYSDISQELDLVAEFNRHLAKKVLDMVENQEELKLSLSTVILSAMDNNKIGF